MRILGLVLLIGGFLVPCLGIDGFGSRNCYYFLFD
jgi:hypothetical protein